MLIPHVPEAELSRAAFLPGGRERRGRQGLAASHSALGAGLQTGPVVPRGSMCSHQPAGWPPPGLSQLPVSFPA